MRTTERNIYVELIPETRRYDPSIIYGFGIGRTWKRRPKQFTATTGVIVKVTLQVPHSLFLPAATVAVIDESNVVAT